MIKTILINKDNPWKEAYAKNRKLVETQSYKNENILVEEETLYYFEKLKEKLLENNIEIGLSSAFRTIKDQEIIKNEYIENNIDYKNFVAPINNSEHLTGLALDIVVKENNNYTEDEKTLEKVHKYLKDYGFILRYPKGKETITGYNYEPWHIRYVGNIPAKIIMDNNLTLEEYLKDYSGVLYINKPKGITSFDVVHEISKLFGIKKVGHTGTLDPLATGVMIVTIGKATKIVELLTAEDKEYIATVKKGVLTDTLDIEGKVLKENNPKEIINLKEVLNSFKKTYLQEVPIFSAIKVNGKKLYDYARNNEKVELPKKEVTIKEIELLEEKKDTFKFKTLVTKGCYIRSLIRDIGQSIDEYMTMTDLIRTKQGSISLEETNTLEEIKNNNFRVHKIDEVLDYPIIAVTKELEKLIRNGCKIENNLEIKDKVIFKSVDNTILGIYQVKDNNLVVWKNFV
ncbi:MAG: tRNA pseudouridine(55) synthase TruB [Bacilli bacterium]|nr:tRNA pseudouridine(55) synthase TruB [Bacilli bacterium]